MANTPEIALSVILYQEDGHWIAQGLEFDITAKGSSPPDASKKFACKVGAELIMSLELEDTTPFEGVGPAPVEFWKMWESSSMEVQMERLPIRIIEEPTAPRVQPSMRISELREVAA